MSSPKKARKKAAKPAKPAASGKHVAKKPSAAKSANLPKASAPKTPAGKAAPAKPTANAAPARPLPARPLPARPLPAKPLPAKPLPPKSAPLVKPAPPKLLGVPGRTAPPPLRPPPVPVERLPLRPSPTGIPPGARPIPGQLPPLAKRPLPPSGPAARPPPPKQQPHLVRSFYWTDLREGDDLPPLSRPAIDRVQIARYAGAANDFNRLQLDEPYAHSLGFRGAFAPGALAMGFVGQLLTNWLRRGQVRKLTARFVKIIWPGDELTCHGRVSELKRDKGICTADLELWAENQKGELVLRGQATCELVESPGHGSAFGDFSRAPPGQKLPPRRR